MHLKSMWGNKMTLLEKLHNNRIIQIVFFLVSMLVLCLLFPVAKRLAYSAGERDRIIKQALVEDHEVLTDIEMMEEVDGRLVLSGWAINMNTEVTKIHVMLNEVNSDNVIILDTAMHEREDVETYFRENWEFGTCGFTSQVEVSKLKKNTCYEIIVVVDDMEGILNGLTTVFTSRKVSTKRFIMNRELFRYNPHEFVAPVVTDAELSEVVNKGTVRGYDLQGGIWVYQYDKYLYAFVASGFGSMEENQIGVPFRAHTSRNELIPEDYIQYGHDYLGIYYEDETYSRAGVLPYQIVKIEIPSIYPVTKISAGLFDSAKDEWLYYFMMPMEDLRLFTEE